MPGRKLISTSIYLSSNSLINYSRLSLVFHPSPHFLRLVEHLADVYFFELGEQLVGDFFAIGAVSATVGECSQVTRPGASLSEQPLDRV